MRHLLFACAISVAALAGAATPASAGPVAPGVAAAMGEAAVSPQTVRWVCTYGRCVWRPHSRVRVPVYAQSWGPPTRPRCEYVRRVGPQGQAHWQQVCR